MSFFIVIRVDLTLSSLIVRLLRLLYLFLSITRSNSSYNFPFVILFANVLLPLSRRCSWEVRMLNDLFNIYPYAETK